MVNIREYKKDDVEGIVSLYNQIYGSLREENQWTWQFMDNPSGNPIIVVAEKDSKIIGQCTLLPTEKTIQGKEVLAGDSIDTMILKEYRGKGLYEEMAKKTYEIGAERGIKIRTGFPTTEALRGLLGDIGGTFVTDIPLFINIYKMDNFLVGIVKLKFLAKLLAVPSLVISKFIYKEKKIKIKENYIIEEINEFGVEFDKLWDKIKVDSPIMTKRSSEFLNWRIKNHPKIDYKTFGAYLNKELVGYIVLKTEKRKVRKNADLTIGNIVDMVGINEDVITALYFKAKVYFKSIKTDFVVSWASETMQYRSLLVKLGFYKTKGGLPFVVKGLSVEKDLEEYISDEKNWYLMPIESDIY